MINAHTYVFILIYCIISHFAVTHDLATAGAKKGASATMGAYNYASD